MKNKKLVGAVIGSLCLFGVAVNAAIIYQQNFETLTLGSINGQDGWFGSANDVVQNTVALDTKRCRWWISSRQGVEEFFRRPWVSSWSSLISDYPPLSQISLALLASTFKQRFVFADRSPSVNPSLCIRG